MVDIPNTAIRAVAEVLYREYDQEFDAAHLSWKDFTNEAARVVGAALPHLVAERDDLKADAERAAALLRTALHLRMHGENAPGGGETWADWDRDTQQVLRHLDSPPGAPIANPS